MNKYIKPSKKPKSEAGIKSNVVMVIIKEKVGIIKGLVRRR